MDRDARELNAAGSKPTPHFPPIVVNRPARGAGPRLRVVAFNAAGGRRFREILACLRRPPLAGADVILLCEVNAEVKRSPGRDVAVELGEALGMSCAYIREFGVSKPSGEFVMYMGNAILSSAPFEEVTAVAMHRPRTPPSWAMRRLKRIGLPTGLVTKVKFDGAEVTVGVAHLHSRCAPAERARQMATYLGSFPASGRAIFGGDLNTTTTELTSRAMKLATVRNMIANPARFHAPQAYEPLFDHLRERGLQIEEVNVANHSTFTFSGLIPRALRPKLDWLAIRELHPVAGTAAVIAPAISLLRRASDHDFITVELEL